MDESPLNVCKKYSPVKVYLDGIFYELIVLKFPEAKPDPAVSLAVYLRVASDSMSPVLELSNPDEQPWVYKAELWASNKTRRLHFIGPGGGPGMSIGRSGATFAEVVAPLLNEGRLELKAYLKA